MWWEQLTLAETGGVSNNAIMRYCQQATGCGSWSWKTFEGWSQDVCIPSGDAPQPHSREFVEVNRKGKSSQEYSFLLNQQSWPCSFGENPPHFFILWHLFLIIQPAEQLCVCCCCKSKTPPSLWLDLFSKTQLTLLLHLIFTMCVSCNLYQTKQNRKTHRITTIS